VTELAKKYNKSPAQIVLRWAIQFGVSSVPKSANAERMKQNLDVFEFQLETDEVKRITAENKNQPAFDRDFFVSAFGFNVRA